MNKVKQVGKAQKKTLQTPAETSKVTTSMEC